MTAPALARPARKGEPGFETGGRVYEHPLTRNVAVSITSVISVIDKPALKFWAAKMCAQHVVDNLAELVALPRDDLFKAVRSAPWSSSSKSANDGDVVHDAIDAHIKGQAATRPNGASLTATRMFQSFLTFERTYQPQWVESEFTVWSDRYGYAGTADWMAKIGSWLVLGDTKTGNRVYPEVGLQLSALAYADYILYPDGTQKPIPVFDRFAVLHVRPTFTRLHPVNRIDKCWEAFKAARLVKDWKDNSSESIIGDAPKLAA